MNKMKRFIAFLLASCSVLLSIPATVLADEIPYDTYNYDYWENAVETPAAYVPDGSISGISLEIGKFLNPQDMCVSPEGDLYIADTGNNRIVVVDGTTKKVKQIIVSFLNGEKEDSFNSPYGVCVSENNQLYIADRDNMRIVVLELDGTLVRIVENATSEVLDESYVFKHNSHQKYWMRVMFLNH